MPLLGNLKFLLLRLIAQLLTLGHDVELGTSIHGLLQHRERGFQRITIGKLGVFLFPLGLGSEFLLAIDHDFLDLGQGFFEGLVQRVLLVNVGHVFCRVTPDRAKELDGWGELHLLFCQSTIDLGQLGQMCGNVNRVVLVRLHDGWLPE